jgi:hypothetical protein
LNGVEHVVRNGRSVAGFGVGAPSEAEAALHSIKVRLDRPPWLHAVTNVGNTILIEVQRSEHIPIARMIVGERVNMVPVRYRAGGDAHALGVGHLDAPISTAPDHPSPWKYAVVMSVVSAATGWALEGIARKFRKRERR